MSDIRYTQNSVVFPGFPFALNETERITVIDDDDGGSVAFRFLFYDNPNKSIVPMIRMDIYSDSLPILSNPYLRNFLKTWSNVDGPGTLTPDQFIELLEWHQIPASDSQKEAVA